MEVFIKTHKFSLKENKERIKTFSEKILKKLNINSKLKTALLAISILPLVSNAYFLSNLSVIASSPYNNEKVTTVRVFLDDEKIVFQTTKGTVKEALLEQGISVDESDLVKPGLDTTLNSSISDIFIKKSFPVVVFDGEKVIFGKSPYLSAPEILKDLGINIYPEDDILVANPVTEPILGLRIYINRANIVYLQVDGVLKEIHTRALKVSDLLSLENITLSPSDRVEPSPETLISNGLNIRVIRVSQNEGIETVDIPFTVQYKDSPDLFLGEKRIEKKGEVGKKEIFYKRILENGIEVGRQIISEKVLKNPTPQVVIRGTKRRPTYVSGSFAEWINDAASKYGVDAGKLQRIMYCESGGRANAIGGGGRYFGLFQYTRSTWASASQSAGFSGADIFDARAQIYVTAWKISRSGFSAWPVCGRR